MRSMIHMEQTEQTRLIVQAYSLYALLRYELGPDADANPIVVHAYQRYQRRVAHRYSFFTKL